MRILGISAFYHDSAAALVEDGASSPRRRRSDSRARSTTPRFPASGARAIAWRARASDSSDVDYVVFYDKPFLKFERLLETYLAFAPARLPVVPDGDPAVAAGEAIPEELLARRAAQVRSPTSTGTSKLLFTEHHLSHAARAFFPSPFDEAAVLTMDGVGEWATTSVGDRPRQPPRRSSRRSISRTRSACSTRRSPTTPASR